MLRELPEKSTFFATQKFENLLIKRFNIVLKLKKKSTRELSQWRIGSRVEGQHDLETFQRHAKGLHETGGSACPEAAQSD